MTPRTHRPIRHSFLRLIAGAGIAIGLGAAASAAELPGFGPGDWVVTDPVARSETYLGQKALRMRNGKAYRTDVLFENGTIEFDIAPKARASFIGVEFRIQVEDGKQNYEHIYFRPHKSGQWDAVQYTPGFHGVSTWQLYQGKGYNARLKIPRDKWFHVKIVVAGSSAKVYVGGAKKPVLVVKQLKGKPGKGYVALWSGLPGKAPAELYTGNFANLVIRPDDTPVAYVRETPPPAGSGYLSRWTVSKPFAAPAPTGDIRTLPAKGELDKMQWKAVLSEPTGLVNLSREYALPKGVKFPLPKGVKKATVLAKTVIHSARAQTKKLNFGYSDEISIFLNGRILFAGNNSFSTRYRRYLGTVKADEDAVYLALKQGANELVLAVSEVWMGWGFIARLEDVEGLRIE
jgi:hypothetical protein